MKNKKKEAQNLFRVALVDAAAEIIIITISNEIN